jgi:hypothetical protein
VKLERGKSKEVFLALPEKNLKHTRKIGCAGSMGHPLKKSLFDNNSYPFQAPILRTDVPWSQYRPRKIPMSTFTG